MTGGLSVVVPIYGNARTLTELHRRLRATVTSQELQLVLVDDASPDDSREVISRLAEATQRWRRCSWSETSDSTPPYWRDCAGRAATGRW